jgi:predicted nucleic acid-binding protein
MAFSFDTDAISELLRPRPALAYIKWLMTVPREDQFTSAVVMGGLYKGAYRSQARERHLTNIENRILPSVTVLPYDLGCAKVFGEVRGYLEETGTILPDADIQIAATAICHGRIYICSKWVSAYIDFLYLHLQIKKSLAFRVNPV